MKFNLPLQQLLFTLITLSLIQTGYAKTSEGKRLETIHHQISSIKSALSEETKKQTSLTSALKDSEKTISSISIKIDKLSKSIKEQTTQINALKDKKKKYQVILDQQQETLAKLVRGNYLLQRQGKLGIFLNKDNVGKTDRFLNYYQALDNSMIEVIKAQKKTIKDLSNVLKEIHAKKNELLTSLKELQSEKKKASHQQQSRQKIIDQLAQSIKTNQQKLGQLNADQTQLTQIVSTLDKRASTSKLNFSAQKYKLTWPVQGELQNLFWQPMANESIKWQGDLIKAEQGEKVHSIYSGKVIYADWLRGYGLLIIIDHGEGYMSLYGRNHALYRKVGDYVNTGDIIATVGNSGGFNESALYFEIRHNSQAVNPKMWVR